MRRAIHQGESAELLNQSAALFKRLGAKSIDRQPLLLQDIHVAEKTQGVLSGCQPVWPLAKIPEQSHIHFAEETFDERWPKFRMVIEEASIAGAGAGLANVACLDFSFPSRI